MQQFFMPWASAAGPKKERHAKANASYLALYQRMSDTLGTLGGPSKGFRIILQSAMLGLAPI